MLGCTNLTKTNIMIMHKDLYLDYISFRGVGINDIVASSPASYVSYLNSVAKLINSDITPQTLRSEIDIRNIAKKLKGQRAANTISNYCAAMRQYIAMVDSKGL